MKFSEQFKIEKEKGDEWFDPFLTLDTKLFIDPFLLYKQEFGPFFGCHQMVIDFFNEIFMLVAKSNGLKESVSAKKALSLLRFPEAEELCLGYTEVGTRGSGSGRGLAKIIFEAIREAIDAGVTELSHFEEIGILRDGIGADRISDITASLLRHKLAEYTGIICAKHNIPTETIRYAQGEYDQENLLWGPLEVDLPRNPFNNKPILLVPKKFLKALPTIELNGFWDYCFDNENETLRNHFNNDVSSKVDKKTIVEVAKTYSTLRDNYIETVEEMDPEPYDFDADPKGYIRWYEDSARYVKERPIQFAIANNEEFKESMEYILKEFRNYIQNQKGWALLWNDNGNPKTEENAQSLFRGIVTHYCRANDIDISSEVNIGRGPVDFKMSIGFKLRALIEMKLAKNTRWWHGLMKQLPKYLEAEDIGLGYFVAIMYTDNDEARIKDIHEIVTEVNQKTGKDIQVMVIDARKAPISASKL